MDTNTTSENASTNSGDAKIPPASIVNTHTESVKGLRTYKDDVEKARKSVGALEHVPKRKGWLFGFGKNKEQPKNETGTSGLKQVDQAVTKKTPSVGWTALTKELKNESDVKRHETEEAAKRIMSGEHIQKVTPLQEIFRTNAITPPIPKNLPVEPPKGGVTEEAVVTLLKNQPSKEKIEHELVKSGVVSDGKEKVSMKSASTAVPNIRTLKNDAAESIQNKQMSVVSIAAAQEMKRTQQHYYGESETSGDKLAKNAKIVGISIGLVLIGILSISFFYFTGGTTRVPVDEAPIAIITSDSKSDIDMTARREKSLLLLLNETRLGADGESGTIIEYRLIDGNIVASKNFLNRLSTHVPEVFVRAVLNTFVFGVYVDDEKNPFFIFKTNDFENAFAGMLAWESTLYADLVPLFKGENTSALNPEELPVFSDVFIKNKNARVLRNTEGNVMLLYGFPDSSTIIITSNENTFFEVLKKLNAQR